MTKGKIIGGVLIILAIAYMGLTSTVVKEGQEAQLTGEVAFNPTTVAQNFWKENAKDYFEKNAVDLNQLITEANGDFSTVASKYGNYSMGDSGELSFIVKGSGVVDTVKNKLRAGYLGVIPDGYSGNVKFRLQIGPVFKGSAVRDSISLISYKDYKNQIEWAQVSVAFHDLILKEIISTVDMNSIQGKSVDFIGCFTVGRPSQLVITPVELTVK